MLRHAARLLAAALITTAALIPGAAVFTRAVAQDGCPTPLDDVAFELLVIEADVIVLGISSAVSYFESQGYAEFTVAPEAFLKGRTSAADQVFRGEGAAQPAEGCGEEARVNAGERLIVIANGADPYEWPGPNGVFVERPEGWRSANPADATVYEEGELLARIRGLTGQYSVPAASEDEGEGIDWWGTVVPVGAVLAGLMGVGLVLMRIWHRIDPS